MRLAALVSVALLPLGLLAADVGKAPGYEVRVQTVLKHDDGKTLWYHPRAAAIPGHGKGGRPAVVMIVQQHLHTSDHYSGMSILRSDDWGKTWQGPTPQRELAWLPQVDGANLAVCDATPGWHEKSKRYLAVGAQVRYSRKGEQLDDMYRANQTAYAIFEPKSWKWSNWKIIKLPPDRKFDTARSACAQWLVKPDGNLLLPFYYGPTADAPAQVTVVEASFDGETVKYLRHGTELALNVVRGLVEPSIAWHRGRYYLTIRNDLRAYVTRSDDGLTYEPIRPWTFDDGKDLGSYNTQAHWLAHSDGLFLLYTRRGANNDHIIRNGAPLFMAQVDPEKLHVIRSTERVVLPERGGEYRNFGARAMSERESWVTVGEGVWDDEARKRGADGSLFVARIVWAKRNRDWRRSP